MNDNDIYTILQGDDNLREAIRRHEQKQSPMPDDLNKRLMERLEGEASAKPSSHQRQLWSWIAAACVAAVMVVVITAPNNRNTREPSQTITQVEKKSRGKQWQIGVGSVIKTAASEEKLLTPPLTPPLQGRGAAAHNKGIIVRQRMETGKGSAVRQRMETKKDVAVRQKMETPESLSREEVKTVLASSVKEEPELKPAVLTERDIPITRPENYRYTPEEIALLKKQADDAYVKWVQLELEIAKYNLEQMAQQ